LTHDSKTIHVIGGPTASGKSAHALALADKYDGVIVNADSMQIYDGLPILTAQPPPEDLAQAPHKLYGHLHPNDACSAGNWNEIVKPLITEIIADNKMPIIVGGSGLYINALLYGLSPIPDIPDEVRTANNERFERLGNDAYFAELEALDPIMASRLHRDHTARIIRAREVIDHTGKSLSVWQDLPRESPPDDWQFDVTLVIPPRETLYNRCNQRFEWMLDNGALEELEAFIVKRNKGEISETALLNNALGVKPLSAYLCGEMDKETAITRGQGETRRYAKRQTTWFNHQIKENKNVAKITILS